MARSRTSKAGWATIISGLAVCALALILPAEAERRIALVVGNGNYSNANTLTNPVKDAKAVAEALRADGFEVTEKYNLDKAAFDAVLKRFGDEASAADWALVYFAGHGVGVGGETYLLPVDVKLARADHTDDEAVALTRVRAKVGAAKKLRLVILDSCRNNPFAARLMTEKGAKRAVTRGLTRPAELDASGELIAYATRESDVADDGDGDHSPFTTALLAELHKPGEEVGFMFRNIRSAVQRATGGQQSPTVYGDLGEERLYFLPPVSGGSGNDQVAVVTAAPTVTPTKPVTAVSGGNGNDQVTAVTVIPKRTKPVTANTMTYEDASNKLVRSFQVHTSDVHSVAFSPDGRFALSGSVDGTLKLWDLNTGRDIQTYTDSVYVHVLSVAFSPGCWYVLSGSDDKTVKLWDVATGRPMQTFRGHTSAVWSVAFSPDGRFALSGSDDNTLKLWDVATGRNIRTFQGHTRYVWSVAFSPDGRFALSGSFDHTLKLWDVATGREIRTFEGHKGFVQSVAFSPDGRFALSGSGDLTLKLWDVATGRDIQTFQGHTHYVQSVAFSPDGRFALSGSSDKTLRLWDVVTGREIRTFQGHTDQVRSVAFSSDGRFALSGSNDKTLKLWDVSEWTAPQQAAK